MTDQAYRDARHKAVMAVTEALSEIEQDRILDATRFLYHNLTGAGVADILDILADHDSHLFWTEPLYDEHRTDYEQLKMNGIDPHLFAYAMQAVIMKGPLWSEVERIVAKAQEVLANG